MADENKVFLNSEEGLTEAIEQEEFDDDRQMRRLRVLRMLLNFFKDSKQEYLLSAVLEFAKTEYDEEVFCQELLSLVQEEYIEIKLISVSDGIKVDNADIYTAKQLIQEGNCDKILVTLKEQRSGILLHNFVDVNIAMLKMKLQFNEIKEEVSQQRNIIKSYEAEQQAVLTVESEFQEKYNGFTENLKEWDNKQKSLENQIEQAKQSLKVQFEDGQKFLERYIETEQESIKEAARNEAVEMIEEEIKSTGKIGQTMQDAQKNIIQYMAIFVAIFALVNVNVVNAAHWTYAELFRVDVIMTTSILTLVTLVHIFTDNKSKGINKMIILLAVLWIAVAFSALI